MRALLLLALVFIWQCASAQKIESIHFNLYTDSLKKGFYNYISVDGKYSDGSWLPLDSTHVRMWANAGRFQGNDIFIDSSYTGDSIRVKAVLKTNPAIWKETVIYIRRRGFDEPLKSNTEVLNDMRKGKKKRDLAAERK